MYSGESDNVVRHMEDVYHIDMSARWTLLKEKLTLRARVGNLFSNHLRGYAHGGKGLTRDFDNDFQHINFLVGISYRFGKTIEKKYKQSSSVEINNRF